MTNALNPLRIFRIVFTKELGELLRDRKTLFWLLAPPFIFPLVALIAAGFIGSQTARYITEGFAVSVVNAEAAPALVAKLKSSIALVLSEVPPGSDIPANTLITLTIPDDFQTQIDSGAQISLTLSRRDSSFASTLALGAVRSEVEGYNASVRVERLKKLGVGENYLTAVTLDERITNLADEAAPTADTPALSSPESAPSAASPGLGAIFLPLALTSWVIGGGLGLIVDTTVGEKERQTIENILVTPANRLGLVAGKLCVVILASLVVMGLWMIEGVGLSLLGEVVPLAAQGADLGGAVAQSLGGLGGTILVLIALLLPFVVFLNSVVMIFCSFANSYRESNTFMFLLQLILPSMVLLSIFSIPPDAGAGWYGAPMLGTILAIRDLFSGSLSGAGVVLATISASTYAIITILGATYTYSRDWALSRR